MLFPFWVFVSPPDSGARSYEMHYRFIIFLCIEIFLFTGYDVEDSNSNHLSLLAIRLV
jgi:hypothetical protein